MRLDHYFQDELTRLRQQGRELAGAYPGLSHYLSHASSDPDVERLLEGAAFLTATLRARVDDQFPELSQGLLQLVAPHLLRITPSLTVLHFQPIPHACQQPAWLVAGCEIDSEPIAGRRCRFRTCQAGWIYPARSQVTLNAERDRLSLTLDLFSPTATERLALEQLTLHLGGELTAASDLYLWLRQRLRHIELEYGSRTCLLPASSLEPIGFAPEEALLPAAPIGFPAHELIQQYYACANTLLFFKLTPPPALESQGLVSQFRLHFHFSRPLPSTLIIDEQSLLPNCFPAANLFKLEAEPIDRHGHHHEYPVRCQQQETEAYEIFSVDRVESWRPQPLRGNTAFTQVQPVNYRPFAPFCPPGCGADGQYRLHSRPRLRGDGLQHSLSFIDAPGISLPERGESISVTLTCCDGDRPTQLPPGAIHQATGNSPSHSRCRNLLRPSAACYPPTDESQHWLLLNQLRHHYHTLLDKERLQALLASFPTGTSANPDARRQHETRRAAMLSLTTHSRERLFGGLPIRGLHSQLQMDGQAFGSEGELYLFGCVLAHFLAQYASINSFHQLEILDSQTAERYQWPPMNGTQPLL